MASTYGMNIRAIAFVVLTISGLAFGQTGSGGLPCEHSALVMRKSDGSVLRYTSDEMKAKSIQRYDIAGPIKQADIKGIIDIQVLVAPDGHVVCAKTVIGHPMMGKPVEEALRKWKFSPMMNEGKPISYVGWLEFSLCNVSCGDAGPSMTILK
jgi:hypothetical protein